MSDAQSATGFVCPECSAPTLVAPGAHTTHCPACRAFLYVAGAQAAARVIVEPVIDAARATSAVKQWMHGIRHRELLSLRADLEPPRLVLLPFARVQANLLGWLFGTRKHTGDKGRVYYTDEEVAIAEAHDVSSPLCEVGDLGVQHLPPLEGVPTIPFDDVRAARLGEVVPALASEDTIEERAHADFLDTAHTSHNLHSITGEDLSVVGARETIVYYPFWRVGYRYAKRDYTTMIDARDGRVAYGRAPGSHLFHASFFSLVMPVAALLMLVGAFLGGAIILGGIEVADASDSLAGGLICVGAAVGIAVIGAGIYLATVAHRGLVRAGEVEDGYGVHAGAELFDTKDKEYLKEMEAERAEIEADPQLAALEESK